MDDVALPVVSLQAESLVSAIQWTLDTVLEVCASFGLQLNLKAKKTEVVPNFRGPGAPDARREWLVDRMGSIPLADGRLSVRCVPRYEHLGAIFQSDGGICAEVHHRVSRALLACRQVRKPILANRHLSVTTRLQLLEALVMPVLLHGAGNWPLLTAAQVRQLTAPYMKWVRTIIGDGFWTTDQSSDLHLQYLYGCPSMALRLAKARLLFGFHLFRDAPALIVDFITSVASAPASWSRALRAALGWLVTMDDKFFSADPATADLTEICHWFHEHRDSGPGRVRRLFRRALHQGRVVGEAWTAHFDLQCTLQSGGVTFCSPSVVPAPQTPPCPLEFECRWCGKQFPTRRQWQNHLWCAHDLPSDERLFMTSVTCQACHKCFWTVNRMQIHLRQSRSLPGGCFERLTWTLAPLETACDIDPVEPALHHARLPAVTVLFATTWAAQSCLTRADADRQWADAWAVTGLPRKLDDQILTEFRSRFDQVLATYTQSAGPDPNPLLWALTQVADDPGDETPVDFRAWALALWALDDLRCVRFPNLEVVFFERVARAVMQLVNQLPIGRLVLWKRRMDEAYIPANVDTEEDRDGAPCLYEPEHIPNPIVLQHHALEPLWQLRVTIPSCQGVPITLEGGRPVIWLMHLFSGRRRAGDCHFWAEQLGATLWPEVSIRIVSFDTAIDPVTGNLACGLNFDRLLRLASSGIFAGCLTGPPCETWSAARHLELAEGRGPRPLRSSAQPWCLRDRSAREMRQGSTGTQLLFNSWRLEVAVVLQGGGSIQEHPWENPDETRASVWRTDVHEQWVMLLPHAFRHKIEQFLYGAKGVKPTCLRCLNLGDPSLVAAVLRDGSEPWRARPSTKLM